MNKFLILCLITLSSLTYNVEAGIFSKTAKVYVTKQIVKSVLTKTARKEATKKLAQKQLLKNELKVGKYEDLTAARPKAKQLGQQTEQLDAHHMPSTNYIKNQGVAKGDGVAMEMQPARHSQTRTYGSKDPALLKESPRDALARDIKDAKNVYQQNGVYDAKVRESLQEVINQNKYTFPNLYNK